MGEFNSYAYKLKRWATWEHIGATLQNFIDRHIVDYENEQRHKKKEKGLNGSTFVSI